MKLWTGGTDLRKQNEYLIGMRDRPCNKLHFSEKLDQGKERVFYWDNLKFILILLVVIGHIIDPYTKSYRVMRYCFFLIYLFHMPLFVFIAGFFSKLTVQKSATLLIRVVYYLVLYVLMKLIQFALMRFVYHNTGFQLRFFSEAGIPWFFLALAAWLCLIYLLQDLKTFPLLIMVFLFGIFIGYDKTVSDYLCLSRIIVFFGFFLIGYCFKPEYVDKMSNSKVLRGISIFFLLLVGILLFRHMDSLYSYRGYLTGRNPYAVLKGGEAGWLIRGIFYFVTALFSFAVMCIVPRRKLFISKLGSRTLQVYFIHNFILNPLNHFKIFDFLEKNLPKHLFELSLILIAIGLVFLLSLKFFSYPFEWIKNLVVRMVRGLSKGVSEGQT